MPIVGLDCFLLVWINCGVRAGRHREYGNGKNQQNVFSCCDRTLRFGAPSCSEGAWADAAEANTMKAEDVTATLDMALKASDQAKVIHQGFSPTQDTSSARLTRAILAE